jgi:uncharacterized caspase-like protein
MKFNLIEKILAHPSWAGIGGFIAIATLLVTMYPSFFVKSNTTQKNTFPSSQKIALVIGNSDYGNSSPISQTKDLRVVQSYTNSSPDPLRLTALKNPINDANLIAKILERKGFKIISGFNKNKEEMTYLIDKFRTLLSTGGIGIFYYSGHAANINGDDYMLPITTKNISTEHEFLSHAINVTELLNPIEILIKDHTEETGAAIVYAAEKGHKAFDGTENNSPFAKAISESIMQSDINDGLFDIFITTTKDVAKQTNGSQIPWFSISTFSDFYFNNSDANKDIELMNI